MNKPRIQQHLRDFNFRQLFIEGLGWDHPPASAEIIVDGQPCTLPAIAHKRGMVAFQFSAPDGERLPDYALRRKIEQQITRTAHEHLIIFTDAARTTQIWQWVKREPGKPTACREHTLYRNQSGEALIQKLENIAFTLAEEETLTLVDVIAGAGKGFDVQRVTKRFYDQFKKEHARFLTFVEGIDVAADRAWYGSVMLNRLMFVYFIQRKGFLDGDPHYLRHRLQRCQEEKGRDKFYSFYRYFLLRLFHEGLGGKARSPELQDLLGRIPYLNGGFFEPHIIEQTYGRIQIPDRAFERIFDYFDQYQWHLDERPLRDDNEINPDVLGFIFEKYINQKQMGAYYTQEDITGYMSRNTIIPFLFDAARKTCKPAFAGDHAVWQLLQADPDRYIYPAIKHGIKLDIHSQPPTPLKAPLPLPPEIERGVDVTRPNLIERRKAWNKPAPPEYALPTEIWREVVARRQRYAELHTKLANGDVRDINDLVTLNLDIVQFAQDVLRNCDRPELLRAFWRALEKISVLDPTVGSGAFLFAALNILKPLYEACLERMEAFVGDLDRSGEKHRPEKFSDFRAVLARVGAHPNADYFILKAIILNNLYGVDIMEEATEICKLRLFLKLAAQVEPDPAKANFGIEPLPDIDFNIRAGNTLVGYATADEVRRAFKEEAGGQGKLLLGESSSAYKRFEENVELADRAFRQFREMQTERGMDSSQFASAKVTLRKQMKVLEDELNKYLASDYGVKTNDKVGFADWLITSMPFHWFVEFFGIVSSGGFDVIIGNPPYVVVTPEKVPYRIRDAQFKTHSTKNLYSLVCERSDQLAQKQGAIALIVQLTALSSEKMPPLQDLLLNRGLLIAPSFPRRPESIFDGVEMPVVIFVSRTSHDALFTSRISRFYTEERQFALDLLRLQNHTTRLSGHRIAKIGTPTEKGIFEKWDRASGRVEALTTKASGHVLYYQEACRYWAKACKGYPFFRRNGQRMSPPHGRTICFKDDDACAFAACLANSSLFYWFYSVFSDCEHINDALIRSFKIPASWEKDDWSKLESRLSASLKENAKRKTIQTKQGHKIEYDELNASKSKAVVDDIDRALALHYGLTDDELDFLQNYDIKYRLGRDAEGDDAE
ncbi:MAG: Eco57I restriction-modification methylase domain-containing protein [Verrucomicrobia bacterium]|nr:Eco57I restriction-modification methylase domain-containing protein [Verrucomicrobiota bacterium]